MTRRRPAIQARPLLVLLVLLALASMTSCGRSDCEDRCTEEWYDECAECADGPVLLESECADIWCEE